MCLHIVHTKEQAATISLLKKNYITIFFALFRSLPIHQFVFNLILQTKLFLQSVIWSEWYFSNRYKLDVKCNIIKLMINKSCLILPKYIFEGEFYDSATFLQILYPKNSTRSKVVLSFDKHLIKCYNKTYNDEKL